MNVENRRGALASLVRTLAVALALLLPTPAVLADRAPIAPAPSVASVLGATTYPLSLVEDDGRAVMIAKERRRIVSAAPSTTEIVFAVGLGDRVVGVTDFCDYPEAAQSAPKIGGFKPNLEAIIGAQPDLVLAVRGFPADIIANLEALKVPVVILNPVDFAGVLANVETVGNIGNSRDASATLVTSLRQRWDAVESKAKGASGRSHVLFEIDASYPGSIMAAGPGTFIDAMLQAVGADNAVAPVAAGMQYPSVSDEAVLGLAPEMVILGDAPYGESVEAVAARPGWDVVPAVRNGRVVALSQREVDVTSRPGPRIVDGLEAVARVVRPELFGPSDTAR
ncbi:MAG: helical backbone metal receptor [Chloroflexi bacterium]|nr:helical backbone metal receptor [Chloroflexota bacterium]